MNFHVRRIASYLMELDITDNNTMLNSGTLDEDERREMARKLREAADDLMYGLDEGE